MTSNAAAFATHEVANQPPPFEGIDLFSTDAALVEAVTREGAGWAKPQLAAYGQRLGSAEVLDWARLAHENPPKLKLFDRFGHRRDEVEFHPAWHDLMTLLVGNGLHTGPWADPRPGAHVARAAGYILHGGVESGSQCPATMTYGSVPVLRRAAALTEVWLPRLLSRNYDRRFAPITQKTGALVGMGMTEKQGGSDVRANSTRAEPSAALGAGAYVITGHKWFFSAPMCDAFLVLAQAPGGLACFFLPRWLPDGTLNAIRIQRLKDKIGNKSNASSEVEFHGATGWLLGEEGRGINTIIEMGTYTRLDCALGSTGLMRHALAQAMHHARHRRVFQKHLADQPLMANVLADLALEVEAATALVMRLARAFDSQDAPAEAAFRRLATPAVKYWVCKRCPSMIVEAMEVLGGNGYVEEGPMGRLYREAPLNSIWEGSGNIMCLDVLRALGRGGDGLGVIRSEFAAAKGGDARLDGFVARLEAELAAPSEPERHARRLTERLMLALQGSLLVRFAPSAVAEAFCGARLGGDGGLTFGTLPAGSDLRAIAERALPWAA